MLYVRSVKNFDTVLWEAKLGKNKYSILVIVEFDNTCVKLDSFKMRFLVTVG